MAQGQDNRGRNSGSDNSNNDTRGRNSGGGTSERGLGSPRMSERTKKRIQSAGGKASGESRGQDNRGRNSDGRGRQS